MPTLKVTRTIKDPAGESSIPQDEIRQVIRAVHVAPDARGWTVHRGGREHGHFDTADSALDFGRKVAAEQDRELIIHRGDGEVIRHADRSRAPRAQAVSAGSCAAAPAKLHG